MLIGNVVYTASALYSSIFLLLVSNSKVSDYLFRDRNFMPRLGRVKFNGFQTLMAELMISSGLKNSPPKLHFLVDLLRILVVSS
jgi:hypothetical protein